MVVSDTSPINYLILIDSVAVLGKLFDEIAIPEAVLVELADDRAPEPVRAWSGALPEWVSVRAVRSDLPGSGLGRGEREAIALASDLRAEALLLDDSKARKVAEAHGLAAVGTLSILDAASRRGLIDLTDALARLAGTSFRASPRLLQFLIERRQ